MSDSSSQDHYEVLQLSPSAEQLVITKVYRLLAAYYHPDNKQTGDEEKFKSVLKAYEVLSDPAKRSRYHLESRSAKPHQPKHHPAQEVKVGAAHSREQLRRATSGGKETRAETDVSERELRRQMLMALYDVRRNAPGSPHVSLLVLAELLGCTLQNLEFSTWYLKEKGFIKITESADFSITIGGVDYVENDLLKKETEKQVLSLPEGRR